MNAVLVLDPSDNVAVAIRPVCAGDAIEVAGHSLVAVQDIQVGHKLALLDIPEGGTIIKYGVAIGVALQPVVAGSHLHLHNMASLYIATRPEQGAGSRHD